MANNPNFQKNTFTFPRTTDLLNSELQFYNSGNDYYFAVWSETNKIVVAGSHDKGQTFSNPKDVLELENTLTDVQFLAQNEKFVVAITEKGTTSTTVRAAYGHLDIQANQIISQECPNRHVITNGEVLNVHLEFVDYQQGISKEHVFISRGGDVIEEETGRHP